MQTLHVFRKAETARIEAYRRHQITDETAESVLLPAYEQQILSPRLLPVALRQWRRPSFDEFRDRTLWSLENALTFSVADVLKNNPQRFSLLTIQMQGLLAKVAHQEDAPDLGEACYSEPA